MATVQQRAQTRAAYARWYRGAAYPPRPDPKLTWTPPATAASPGSYTVLPISHSVLDGGTLVLSNTTDYVLTPQDVFHKQLRIQGGRNIVMIGFEANIDFQSKAIGTHPGIWLDQVQGNVYLEGIKLQGSCMHDGIDIDMRLAGQTFTLQNAYIHEGHTNNEIAWTPLHCDNIQSWNGPQGSFRVDRLSANHGYQGIFLEPDDTGGPAIGLVDVRNLDLRAGNPLPADLEVTSLGSVGLWYTLATAVYAENVWLDKHPRRTLAQDIIPHIERWGNDTAGRRGVWVGQPPYGRFVDPADVGLSYVSPGYQ